MVKKLLEGFHKLFADRRQFILECIRVGMALWFLILLFIPFYTITNGVITASFNIRNYNIWFFYWLFWFGIVLAYVFFRLLNVIKPAKYLLIVLSSMSVIFTLISMVSFLSDRADVALLFGVTCFLNVGFYFNVIFIVLMFLLALKEKLFLSIIDKVIVKKQK